MSNNITDSLFVEFYNEKYKDTIQVEVFKNSAFISYSLIGDSLHLWEVYIKKENRKSTMLYSIVKKVLNIASNLKCKKIVGYVENTHSSPDNIVRLLKILDFKLYTLEAHRAIFIKEV